MIVHDFPFPAKLVRIDTHNFCLMLVLVIPKLSSFFFSLTLLIVPEMLLGLFAVNWVPEGLKKSKNFWASVQAGVGDTAQGTSYMPPALKLCHNFTMKVKDMPHMVDFFYNLAVPCLVFNIYSQIREAFAYNFFFAL